MQQESNQSTPNKGRFRPLAIVNLIPGMVIGVLIGIVGFLVYQKHLPEVTRTLYIVTLVSFGVLVLTFVLLYAFKKQITALIFGKGVADLGEVINDAQSVTDAVTDRLAVAFLAEAAPEVQQRVRNVLPRLANWFIWSRFRNWWWQWVLGIFVSLGGLTGTLLLMNQNELLQNQNTLIQRQMFLDEANRRSALVVLMSNIFDKVDREIEAQQKIDKDGKYNLSQSLIGQIAALSHSFKPYRFMEGDSLIERPLSPERGQLLITLTLLPLDTATLNKVYNSATFAQADLQRAVLKKAYLSGADLRGVYLSVADLSEADLSEANLLEANLLEADLSGADLSGADLSEADLRGADLLEADLRGADLSGADSRGANLSGADLSKAYLYFADLSVADLSVADLSEAELNGADLKGADLSGADLSGADLSEADLSGADLSVSQIQGTVSLYQCKNLHDSLLVTLQQSNPNLFQKPKDN